MLTSPVFDDAAEREAVRRAVHNNVTAITFLAIQLALGEIDRHQHAAALGEFVLREKKQMRWEAEQRRQSELFPVRRRA